MSVTLDTCIDCTNATAPIEALYRDVIVCDADGNRYVRVYNEAPVTIDEVQVFGKSSEEAALDVQTVTASWVDWGAVITDTKAYNTLTVFIKLTHNNSVNNRVRLVASVQSLDFTLPIKTVSASDVKVLPHYYEFDTDTTQNMALSWDIDNTLQNVQLQIQAGTVGATGDTMQGWYVLGYK